MDNMDNMGTHEVVIMVTDVNDAPLEICGRCHQLTYAENDTVATWRPTLRWIRRQCGRRPHGPWMAPDAGDFTISSGGVLTFSEFLPTTRRRQTPTPTTNTMVTVKADAGAEVASLDVTIMVTDVDEMVPRACLCLRCTIPTATTRSDKEEAVTALRDYLGGQLSKAQMVDVIRLYFGG